ncbi:unnamed protein product [Psylliodes chrysocephalus]|uniref:C2H2-type domain-containing protein n=1 Tax=Psylliodes chrysocephalus TaxID=3402493 RepID=A0A9P0D0M3_9CUCU|nr:unnamed protein product [Psylliodes chrysocephala]
MSVILSDSTLDKLKCTNCFKYLSVKPVKTYKDGSIKCGRCTEENDEGILCVYNCFGDNHVFKCNNRFDGCRKLLNYVQVIEHEEECFPLKYECPNCPGVILTTYMLEAHFQQYHFLSILKTPIFYIYNDLVSQTFLYRLDDVLFFIHYKVDVLSNIFNLSASYLVNAEFNIRFNINFNTNVGNEDIDPLEIPTYYQAKNLRDNISISCLYVKVSVTFDIINVPYYQIIVPSENTVIPKESEVLEERRIVNNFEYFHNLCLRSGIDWPAKIKTYNFPSNMTVSVDFTHLIKINRFKTTNIYLHCYNCFVSSFHKTLGGFVRINRNLYFLCDICFRLEKRNNKYIKYGGSSRTYRKLHVTYTCLWGCGISDEMLSGHEYFCPDQPEFDCPIRNCEVSAPHDKLLPHMLEKHEVYSCTTFTSNIDLGKNILNSVKFIEKIVWVMPFFVVVKFTANSRCWKVSIDFCNMRGVPKDLRVKALLYTSCEKLIDVVTEDYNVYVLPFGEIRVHCLLERDHNIGIF